MFRVTLILLILASASRVNAANSDKANICYKSKDYACAIQEWKHMAEQGDGSALFSLGHMYVSGKGVEQDYFKAAEYFKLAAEQGNTQAQYLLGNLYRGGKGVKQDKSIAKYWFGVVCESTGSGCDYYQKLDEAGY